MTRIAETSSQAFHGAHRVPWITILGAVAIVGIYLFAGPIPDTLIYDRMAVVNGDAYRLLTGHLVHLDSRHLWLNAGAFLILGAAYETSGIPPVRYASLLLGATISISALLLSATPQTVFYCGFSAVLNALFTALIYALWRDTKHWLWPVLLAVAFAKIGWEWQFGSVLNATLLWPPHLGAHFAGALFGLIFEMLTTAKPDNLPRLNGLSTPS